jgi:hypothetical protein
MRPNRIARTVTRWFSLGRGLLIGGCLLLGGAALEAIVIGVWLRGHFGALNEPRRSVLGMLLMSAGAEVCLFSFLHAVLKKHARPESGRNA